MRQYICEILPADGLPIVPEQAPVPPAVRPPSAAPQKVVEGARRTTLNEARGTVEAFMADMQRKIDTLRAQVAYATALAGAQRARPAPKPAPKIDPEAVREKKAQAESRHLAGITDLAGYARDTEEAEGGDREFRPREAVALTPEQRRAQVWAGMRPSEQFNK